MDNLSKILKPQQERKRHYRNLKCLSLRSARRTLEMFNGNLNCLSSLKHQDVDLSILDSTKGFIPWMSLVDLLEEKQNNFGLDFMHFCISYGLFLTSFSRISSNTIIPLQLRKNDWPSNPIYACFLDRFKLKHSGTQPFFVSDLFELLIDTPKVTQLMISSISTEDVEYARLKNDFIDSLKRNDSKLFTESFFSLCERDNEDAEEFLNNVKEYRYFLYLLEYLITSSHIDQAEIDELFIDVDARIGHIINTEKEDELDNFFCNYICYLNIIEIYLFENYWWHELDPQEKKEYDYYWEYNDLGFLRPIIKENIDKLYPVIVKKFEFLFDDIYNNPSNYPGFYDYFERVENTATDTTTKSDSRHKPNGESEGKDREVYSYISVSSSIDTEKLTDKVFEGFEAGNKLYSALISPIKGDDIDIAKANFKFFLTGSGAGKEIKLEWKHEILHLKFFIRLLTNTNTLINRDNAVGIFINRKVSPGKARTESQEINFEQISGDIWPRVAHVFGYKNTNSLRTKQWNDELTEKSKAEHLLILDKIAEIVFACKKETK